MLIPANTVLTGTARIDGERMMITVSAVQYRGSVIPVELLVYDMDGGEGISVPASDEISAVKEIAANAGSGLGSSITITDDAGTQLLSDLGRSVIQRHGAVRRAEDAAGQGDAQSRVPCPAAAPAGITRKPLNIHKPNTLKKDEL